MPDRFQSLSLGFSGGYATDLPTQARSLGYFLRAENVIPEVSGAWHKVGGAIATNTTAVSGNIVGMFDYWKAGLLGAMSQKFIIVTSTGQIYRDDMDGVYDSITGSVAVGADVVPIFCQARDLLTIWTSANNAPIKYDQNSNATLLGGSPPLGRGAVFHVNRIWTWGELANPSRLTYGSSTTAEDFVGSDSGSIEIDPQDGDIIIGAASFKGFLIAFKGPNKGSIHIIAGTSPTGGEAFSRQILVRGIALQTHNSIVPVGDDLLFMSDRGIHSLSATQTTGNFAPGDITRFLHGHFREKMDKSRLRNVWGVDYAEKSSVLWTYASPLGGLNDSTLGLSYVRLEEEGWKPFTWTRGGAQAAAIRINNVTKSRELIFGSANGFTLREDTTARSLPGDLTYSLRLTTPQLLLAAQDTAGKQRGDVPFNLQRFYLRGVASGNYNVRVALTRDEESPEQYDFHQGVAGFLLGTSILGAGTLGGTAVRIAYSEPRVFGQARSVQFDIIQGGLNEDANLLELGVDISPVGQSDSTTL